MRSNTIFCKILAVMLFVAGCTSEAPIDQSKAIIVETTIPKSTIFEYRAINRVDAGANWKRIEGKSNNGKTRWIIPSEQPVQVQSNFFELSIASPGDSISVTKEGDNFVYSGKGSEKLNMLNEIIYIKTSLSKPSKKAYDVKSISDYARWEKYLDEKLSRQLPLLESKAGTITPFEFNYIKAAIVNAAESDRLNAFEALFSIYRKMPGTLVKDSLQPVWDSLQDKSWGKWLRSLPEYYGSLSYINSFNNIEVIRRFEFNTGHDSLSKKELRTYAYYNNAKDNYKGLLRERLMIYILDEKVITEMGLANPMTQVILNDYFKQPGYSEHKDWVKQLQLMAVAKAK